MNSAVSSSVRLRYLIALTFVAFLSVSAYVLLSWVISAQENNAAVINTSGRQRMLSQRMALFAQQLVLASDRAERDLVKGQLVKATDRFERAHLKLTLADQVGSQPSAELQNLPHKLLLMVSDLYFSSPLELDAQVRDYIAAVRRLLAAPDTALIPQNPDLDFILAVAPGRLLESLDFMADQYEEAANEQIAELERFEIGILAITLLALLCEGLLIFYPLERALSRNHQSLLHGTLHDVLTELPNRALLTDRLEQALLRQKRYPDTNFAVLFLDLNRFKAVNDSLGHRIGDELLVALSQRLKTCVRDLDTVARLGGDEFAILLENISSTAAAETLADRINGELEHPFELSGHTLNVSTSIGIVLSKASHTSPEDVLQDADVAMYQAKVKSTVGFEVFTGKLRELT